MPPQQSKRLLDFDNVTLCFGTHRHTPRGPLDMVRDFGLVKIGGCSAGRRGRLRGCLWQLVDDLYDRPVRNRIAAPHRRNEAPIEDALERRVIEIAEAARSGDVVFRDPAVRPYIDLDED